MQRLLVKFVKLALTLALLLFLSSGMTGFLILGCLPTHVERQPATRAGSMSMREPEDFTLEDRALEALSPVTRALTGRFWSASNQRWMKVRSPPPGLETAR